MPEPIPPTGLPWRAAPLLLFVLLAASPWNFPKGSDGVAMLATAEALLYRGTLAVDDRFLEDDEVSPSAMRGSDGLAYVKYGLGLPLVEIPLLAVADAAAHVTGWPEATARTAVLSLLNPLLATLTCLLAGAVARHLGGSAAAAQGVALATGTCTLLSFHATTEGSDTLLALLLTAATLALARHATAGGTRQAWICGVLIGYAVLTKPLMALAAPVFAAAMVLARLRESALERPRFRVPLREWFHSSVAPTWVPAAAAALVTLALNAARFGSPWVSGYNDPVMTGAPGPAIYGLLLGVNKGLLWYAPPAALGLVRTPRLVRVNPPVGLVIFALTAVVVMATARFYEWGGGWTWGPRYLLPVVPLLVAACAGAPRWAWRAACGAGLAVSLLGTVISDDAYRRTTMKVWMPEVTGTMQAGVTRAPGTVVQLPVPPEDVLPPFSAIVGHTWLAWVAAAPCDCSTVEWWCACRTGPFETHPRFLSPPWLARFSDVRPTVPHGVSLLRPAALRYLYRRYVFAPDAFPPGDRR